MSQIQNFPFHALPQFSASELDLRRRLFAVYQFLDGQKDFFETAARPFADLMGTGVSLKLDHLDRGSFADLSATLPQRALIGVVRCEPRSLRAFLVMDTGLVQFVTAHVLSGGKITPDQLAGLELKPITPLQEAVVEYIVVCLLEQISQILGRKNFDLRFETVLNDMPTLAAQTKATDEYAAFSVRVRWQTRDFFIKVLMPVVLCDEFGLARYEGVYAAQRLPTFEGLGLDVALLVGSVTLSYEDLTGVTPGDIILLDETALTKEANEWAGRARLGIVGGEVSEGWWVTLKPGDEHVSARIDAAL